MTEPLLSPIDEPTRLALSQAAVLVDDAKHGRTTRRKMDARSLWFYRLYYGHSVRWTLRGAVLVQLLLAVIEYPALPIFDIFVKDIHWVAPLIEVLCLAVYCGGAYIRFQFSTRKSFLAHKWTVAMLICLTINSIDALVAVAVGFAGYRPLLISRCLRPFYAAYHSTHIRKSVRDIFFTMPGVVAVLSMAFFLVIFFTMINLVAFAGTAEGRMYFPSFVDGFINMYVCLTTANFPDVMMPGFSENGWASLIFILYLLLTLYFMMNLVLAVVYNNYRGHLKADVKKRFVVQRIYLRQAFSLLDGGSGYITEDHWCALWEELQASKQPAVVRLMFHVLDENRQGRINQEKFLDIVRLMHLSIRCAHPTRPIGERLCPKWHYSRAFVALRDWPPYRWLERIIKSDKLDPLINILIVFNAILTIILLDNAANRPHNTSPGAAREAYTDGSASAWLHVVDLIQQVLTYFFALEQTVKIWIIGLAYFKLPWNTFDFVIVAVTVVDNFSTHLGWSENIGFLVSYFTMFRALRLLRLLGKFKHFKIFVRTLSQLAKPLSTYWGLQIMTFYFFIMIGFFIFAGKITPDNAKLREDAFGQLNYYANNFNSISAAYVTMFEIMVTNNWHVIVGGYVVVTGTKATWLYFMVFHVLTVNIITNIVVAFTLEVFIMQWELNDKKDVFPLAKRVECVTEMPDFKHDESGRLLVWSVDKNYSSTDVLQRLFGDEIMAEIAEAEAALVAKNSAMKGVGGSDEYIDEDEDGKARPPAIEQSASDGLESPLIEPV